MTDVFVSYSAIDRAIALPVIQALERQNWRVFWDRSIPVGKKWQDVLEQQLKRAKCVVVLLTRESLKSSWVTFEASIGLEQKIMIPLIIDPSLNPQTDLPEIYRDLHVASIPNNTDLSLATITSELWLRTIRDTIIQSSRRRLFKAGALALSILVTILTFAYITITSHNVLTMWQAGIGYLERGAFSKEENERLQLAIRNATVIDLLAPNATNFTSAFRDDLPAFLKKRDARMRVLFADPNGELYDSMMAMTNKGIERDAKARESDKGLPARSKQILLSYADYSTDKLKFRQFNTEFRAPIILIDKKYCFLTVRLTPDQAKQSLRIELASESAGTKLSQMLSSSLRSLAFFLRPSAEIEDGVESCKRHFEAVWARSKDFQ
jgi:hypothetical protein